MAFKFMQAGAAGEALAKQHEAEVATRKDRQYKMWRFRLQEKESAKITFVDGDLNADGHLQPPRFYEHTVFVNGKWENFVCPEKTNPALKDTCPICQDGDRPSLVAAFTVIDHRQFQSTKDKNKIIKDQPRLLLAKPQTFEILQKHAQKRGGLATARFEVTRTSGKDAAVGSMYDFEEKLPVEQLKKLYTQEVVDPVKNTKTVVTKFVPADYEDEIVYRTGDELRKIGFGNPNAPKMAAPTENHQKEDTTDYASEL